MIISINYKILLYTTYNIHVFMIQIIPTKESNLYGLENIIFVLIYLPE